MTYVDELDDVALEIKKGATATLVFWPKVPGTGNVALLTDPTFEVFDTAGASKATGTATRTTVEGVTRVDCSIATSGHDYSEDNPVRIDWTVSGVSYSSYRYFDVVYAPYTIELSQNDLQDELADVGDRLTALAARQKSSRTADQLASSQAWKAWGELRSKLKRICTDRGVSYPRAVISQVDVRRVHVLMTCARVVRLEGAEPESKNWLLAKDLEERANNALAGLPEIKFAAIDSPAVAESVKPSRVVIMKRGWP